MLVIAGLLLPFAVSYLSTSLLLNQTVRGPRFAVILLNCILALGLALGVSSCTFFLWLVILGEPSQKFILTESLLFASLAAILLYFFIGNKSGKNSMHVPVPIPKSRTQGVLLICLLIALSTRFVRFMILSMNNPHGDVDAFATWNLRAHFLFADGPHWQESFSYLLSLGPQPDYPLLLSATVARLWSYLGEADPFVPSGVALLFTFSIIGLVMASLTILRGRTQGFLAALVLVGTPYLIKHGSSQYADVPLAFYILATLALFSLQDGSEENTSHTLTLAGTMAGFAAWTKNEGILFLPALILARLFVIVPKRGWERYLKEMLALSKGLLPVLAVLVYYKIQIAPGTTSAISQGVSSILNKLQEMSGYLLVGEALGRKLFRIGHPGLVLLVIYLILLGRQKGMHKIGIATPVTVLSLILAGYVVMFITTPFGVEYMLATTLDRQWLHLWPSVVLMWFLMVNTPEEASQLQGPSDRTGMSLPQVHLA